MKIGNRRLLFCWLNNVGPTLGQHTELRRSQKFCWTTSGQRWAIFVLTPRFANKKGFISWVEQHRANVGPTSRFANKRILIGCYINIGPTLGQNWYLRVHVCIYISSNATNAMINSSTANYTYVDKANKLILFVSMCLSGKLICLLILNMLLCQ